ncbi:TRAP transporter large permease [Salipiger abyssi]|uniref:TRAP transporter large permease protein n=1 Tax=Salipiger abyssi TaxID=1250539 RepID=A0A1P8UN74_9RHOB|nr:TRAP transporter large permease [Salipiger abyssi]APZ50864.1 TRAP transporter, DctM subunit [Salipiger abyssi]
MILVTLLLLLGLMALSIPVAAALGILAIALDKLYAFFPLTNAIGEIAWSTSASPSMVAIPLFVLLGQLMLHSDMAGDMYRAMRAWLGWLPGGLMHANIGSSSLFAATSGSSVATAATITSIALPEARANGYNEKLFCGTLAAGGTLGILIPPSINLILYAVITETSVTRLYISAVVPGLLLAALFSALLVAICLLRPGVDGRRERFDLRNALRGLPMLLPPLLVFFAILGSIYAGLATPTEAAALGVAAAAMICLWRGKLSWQICRQVLLSTMETTAMIMLIVIAAAFLNFVLSGIGLVGAVTQALDAVSLTPFWTMVLIILFYVVLGCVMESLSLMIATTPIFAPIVFGLGYDPIWFGIVLMIVIEMALITPPVGMNLYIVQGVRKTGSIGDVMTGSAPFVIAMTLMIALLLAFPQIALLSE